MRLDLVSRLRWWWRKVTGHCVLCGENARKLRIEHRRDCYHCYNGEFLHLCHWCSKAWTHGKHYGMGPDALIEQFEKEVLGG